jgi:hypothetical protein
LVVVDADDESEIDEARRAVPVELAGERFADMLWVSATENTRNSCPQW